MPVDFGMGIHPLCWYGEGKAFTWTGTMKGKVMRNYIWVIVALGSMYLVWKGLDFYSDEQKRKHEFEELSLEQTKLNHEQAMQDRELNHAAEESEKDRKLQREILKNQQREEGQSGPQ